MDIEQILTYLKTLIKEEEIIEKLDYYIFPTICHNPDTEEAQKKLYLYKNIDTETPLFHCYTECSETFNIYQFIQKYFGIRGEELTYSEAMKKFHGKDFKGKEKNDTKEIIKYDKKFQNPLNIELPTYNENCLQMFKTNYTDPWAIEGIDLEILKKFKISYSKSYEGVIIPHYDWRGRLIGLRIRNYNPIKEKNFKYMPAYISNIFYSHPLSLNFFGLFQNQTNIKKAKKAIIFESEKACLQYEQIFDTNNISLAVCGKNISKWQMDILVYFLKIEELIIGFDKEYNNYSESFHYFEKIKKQINYLTNFMNVDILIDNNNIFKSKESPVDRTNQEFLKLEKWRI